MRNPEVGTVARGHVSNAWFPEVQAVTSLMKGKAKSEVPNGNISMIGNHCKAGSTMNEGKTNHITKNDIKETVISYSQP